MSFLSTFFHSPVSKAITSIATEAGSLAVNAYAPGLGSLVEFVGHAVLNAETVAPTATGAEKKASVKAVLDIAAPLALSVLASVSGRTIADPTVIGPALDAMIDNIVTIYNALGVFPPKATPLIVVPAKAA